MNDCLVTRLKGVVNNDNLKYFDALRMIWNVQYFNGEKRLPLKFYSEDFIRFGGVGVTIKPLENCHVVNGNNDIIEVDGEYTFLGTETFSVLLKPVDETQPIKFLMKGMSKMTDIIPHHFQEESISSTEQGYLMCEDADSLKYVIGNSTPKQYPYLIGPAGTSVSNPYNVSDYLLALPGKANVTPQLDKVYNFVSRFSLGDLSEFTGFTSLWFIRDNGWVVEGDVSSIAGAHNINTISLDGQTEVTGDIAAFGAMTNLVELRIWQTKITGTVESLVAAQVAAGRTTGTIRIWNSNGKVTFQGNPVSAGHHNIQWTSASNIVVGNEYIDN